MKEPQPIKLHERVFITIIDLVVVSLMTVLFTALSIFVFFWDPIYANAVFLINSIWIYFVLTQLLFGRTIGMMFFSSKLIFTSKDFLTKFKSVIIRNAFLVGLAFCSTVLAFGPDFSSIKPEQYNKISELDTKILMGFFVALLINHIISKEKGSCFEILSSTKVEKWSNKTAERNAE